MRRGSKERSPGPTGQRPGATAGPAQAPAPPRLSRHSQFRISEMKTARPRIPSPFDTAGIVARDHDRPATHQTATTATAARSPRGALQAAATAAASAARRRRDGSRAPAGGRRARLWRHLPPGGGGAAGRAGPPLRRRGRQCPGPLPGYPRRSPGDPAVWEGWLLGGWAPEVGGAAAGTRLPVTAIGADGPRPP